MEMLYVFPIIFASAVLTNLVQVCHAVNDCKLGTRVELVAAITTIGHDSGTVCTIGLRDGTVEISGNLRHPKDSRPAIQLGDIVKLSGQIRPADPYHHPLLNFDSLEVLSHGPHPMPIEVTAQELLSGSVAGKFISIKGIVLDSFRDEIDTDIFLLALGCERDIVYAHLTANSNSTKRLKQLIGAEVRIRGSCGLRGRFSFRPLSGYMISINPSDNIEVLRRPENLFDAPELKPTEIFTPAEVLMLSRRRTTGTVRATWQSHHAILATQHGTTTVEFSEGEPLPRCGQDIEIVGLTETDLYNINFSHAIWRVATNATSLANTHFKNTHIRNIYTDKNGRDKINPQFHGRAITVSGTIKEISRHYKIRLDEDGFMLPVDCSSTPSALKNLLVGSVITVSGLCIMEADTWSPYSTFPRIRGFTLVLNRPEDLIVNKQPIWWTSGRLLVILAFLFAALIGFVIWSWFLNRLVERRSRQLAKEKMAHDKADVRAEERTRLSVELHDTIAQNLSGIALQLDAVQLAAEEEPELLFDSIQTTQQSLNSCRQNLRHCLWDLRSRALEEKSLANALSRTLTPHSGNARLDIDCPIRTQGMSDNAIHAMLCIIRELVINSIRHGKASHISIIGRETSGMMDFCVTDDGCGFNPVKAPWVSE